MATKTHTCVILVDMLGFADLVEGNDEDLSRLRPSFKNIEDHGTSHDEPLLVYRFINFHRCLEATRLKMQNERSGTTIIFSDSGFFEVDDPIRCINYARELMLNLVQNRIPARMGIGYGSFRFLRYNSDASEQVAFHTCQFLGTAVVRAYRAENCKGKGMRIFLHPSVDEVLSPSRHGLRVLPTPETNLKWDVKTEVNWLEAKPMNMGSPARNEYYADVLSFDGVAVMHGDSESDFQEYYQATFDAMNRMRLQLGRDGYPVERYNGRTEWENENSPPD